MKLIDVTWTAILWPDSDAFMVKRETTLMPPWAGSPSNAADVAADVFKSWCDIERWDEWFGLDSGDGDCVVIIHDPANIAGRYLVNAELSTVARASPLSQKDSDRIDAMLVNETV